MKRFAWICGLLLIAAGGTVYWSLRPQRTEVLTDAGNIREPADSSPLRRVLWQPAQLLPPQINSDRDDYEPRVSADGQSLFFVRGKAGGAADIYVCNAQPGGWSEPQALSDVNSDRDDLGPAPSADGMSLYFYSDRDGGLGGYDLWLARRGPDGWRTPINLGPAVNSAFNDYGPAIAPDGEILLFASNRPKPGEDAPPPADGWTATLREEFQHRDYDLYAATVTDAGFGRAAPLAALNTSSNEGAPAVSPFGDFVYFSSDRTGGRGGFDLYRTRRVQGEYRHVENLGSAVNTDANELDPAMSLGGYALYFSSNRRTVGESNESAPRYRLYSTTSREVFAETEFASARVDWSAIWRQIRPNLMWGLLALLLLALLIALLRDARRRKLSLLARCLLASIATHMLIMFLLNFWRVTAGVVEGVRRGGRIQVAFSGSGSSSGGGITGQIRGGLTDVSMPAPSMTAPARIAAPMPVHPRLDTMQIAVEPSERPQEDSPQIVTRIVDAMPQIPRGSPQAATPQPPSSTEMLNVALPTDATRIATQEPDSSLAAPTPVEVAIGKLQRVVATSQPAGMQDIVSLQPHSRAGVDTIDSDARITTVKVADAIPRMASARPLPTAAALVAIPLGVALPDAPGDATAFGDATSAAPEATLTIAAQLGSPVRGTPGIGTGGGAGFAPATIQQIGPQSTGGQIPDIPMTGTIGVAHDARPSFGSPGAPAGASTPSGGNSTLVLNVPLPHSPAPGGIGALTGAAEPGGSGNTETASEIPVALPGIARLGGSRGGNGTGVSGAGTGIELEAPTYVLAPTGHGGGVGGGTHGTNGAGRGGSNGSNYGHPEGLPGGTESMPGDATVAFGSPIGRGHGARGTGTGAGPLDINPRLPTEILPPQSPYVQRQSDTKLDITKRMGGSEQTEKAVALALEWLARHQSPNGRWSGGDFDDNCGRCGSTTDIQADVALTGLSLLCFLGAGHTHTKDGPYRANVQRGIAWLLTQQDDDGDLRSEETMYSHGIASIALSEAYGMTRDHRLEEPVRKAIRFIRNGRSPQGGWRYEPGQAGDTSVFGWQVMALKSASLSGIDVPPQMFDYARAWPRRVSRSSMPGRYAYMPGRAPTRSMTAEMMFALQLLGANHDEPRMAASVEFITEQLPDWNNKPNTYYWYYGTLALYQHQGPAWKKWNDALIKQLLPHQRKTGPAAGSWNTVGEWAKTGGRVYQTALCTLMLEVYYRYLPLYSVGKPDDPAAPQAHVP